MTRSQALTFDCTAYGTGERVSYQGSDRISPEAPLVSGVMLLTKQVQDLMTQDQNGIYRWRDAASARQMAYLVNLLLDQAVRQSFAKAA